MSLVFFTDRDLGKRFPAILRESGLTVERHDDHFAPTAPDEEWLQFVGERGWIAVTHDRRIRYKPNQLAKVRAHKVALLVVVGHAPFQELTRSFVATKSRIERFAAKHKPRRPWSRAGRRPSPRARPRNRLLDAA